LLGVGQAADAAEARFRSLAVIGSGLLVAALIAVGVISTKMAADFQQGVNRLKTGAGDATDSFSTLAGGILKVSVATGLMSGPLTKAMYEILSSGQRGAQAFDTLSAAAKGAVIEQANVVDVSDTLAGAMTNFGTKTFGAVAYMNGLITAVSRGRITLQDLSTAMGPIEPVAHAMGISFADLSAAMSTQTNAAIPAARAATGLRFMMQALEVPTTKASKAMQKWGLDTVAVADEMKVSLPGALQMIYDAAKKAGPEGSVPFDRAVSDMVGGQRSLGAFLALTGSHMKDFAANSAAIAASMRTGAGEVAGWALAQTNFNVIMDRAKAAIASAAIGLGLLLLPALGRIVGIIPQVVDYVTNFSAHANVLVPILAGVAAIIAGFLVPAVIALAAGVIAATWPVLAIGAAVAGLVAIFMHWYSTNAGFKAFIDTLVNGFRTLWSLIQANFMPTMQRLGAFFQSTILPVLQQVGSFIIGTFKPAWDQLVTTWKQNLLPGLQMLWGLFQQLLPVLKVVGIVLLASVVLPMAAVIAIVVVAGVAIMKFVALLIQGWGLLVSFAGAAFSAIGTTITNFKNLVGNTFNAIGTFIHDKILWIYNHNVYVKAFVDLIVNEFHLLQNIVGTVFATIAALIGQKLAQAQAFVATFVNVLGGQFSQLGSSIQSKVSAIGSWIASTIGGWANAAYQWGANLIGSFINGIWSMIGGVISAAQNVMGQVANILGFHSPAKEGPGKDADTWAPNLMKMYTQGLVAALPNMQAALNTLMIPVGNMLSGQSPTLSAPMRAPAPGASSQASSSPINVNVYLAGAPVAKALMPHIAQQIRTATGAKF